MTRNDDDLSDNDNELSPRYDADPVGNKQRSEPSFSRFDEDDEDGYEEPDRDTDYTSGYRADSVDEEVEEFSEGEERDQLLTEDPDQPDADEDTWLEKEVYLDEAEDSGQNWPLSLIAVAIVALVLLGAGGFGVMQQRAAAQEEIRQLRATLATTASPEDVAASRAALEEMKQSYDKLSALAQAMTLENRRLADTVAGLEAQLGVQQAVLTKAPAEADRVKPATPGEATLPQVLTPAPATPQPATPQPATPKPAAPKPAASETLPQAPAPAISAAPEAVAARAPEPAAPQPVAPVPVAPQAPAPQPEAISSAVATSSGPWFVNFGSYASRAMAESWAGKLHPAAGKVIVVPNSKNGQTLYRVRVVELADRGSAQAVARTLEAQLRVSELWVGKE